VLRFSTECGASGSLYIVSGNTSGVFSVRESKMTLPFASRSMKSPAAMK